jgi:hypothetical protein
MNVGSNRQLAGEFGGKYITAADGTVTGNWMEIHAVSTSILSGCTSNITGLGSGVTIQAGDSISGVFTSLALSSGGIVAYNRKWV